MKSYSEMSKDELLTAKAALEEKYKEEPLYSSYGSEAMTKKNKMLTLIVLLISSALLIAGIFFLRPEKRFAPGNDYAEYERAKIIKILADNTAKDPASDGAYRGEQLLIAELKTGQYKGKTMQAYNYVGPLYGAPLKEGDSVVLVISTYGSGEVTASVFDFYIFSFQ